MQNQTAQISPWPADQISRRKVGQLVEYARNSRLHSAQQVAQIAASIKEWGWTMPILVDEADMIIAGHGRVMAAVQLGLEEVPVMVARGWSETKKRAYVIADNKLALNADWDENMLRLELQELQELGFGVEVVGFSPEELENLFGDANAGMGLTDPDAVPELADPVSRPGDRWVLDLHIVGCGDATRQEDVERIMVGRKADACWTDPPYNVNYESKLAGKIKNDSMKSDKFLQFLTDSLSMAFCVMKAGAALYVAHADTEGLNFRSAFMEAGFKISGCLVWVKNSLVLGRSDYQWQHEPILYGWKPGAAHRWYGGRKQTTIMQLGGSLFTQNPDGTVTVRVGDQSLILSGENLTATPSDGTVLHCEKPKRSAEHPTMKPVELISKMLRNSTREGDLVLDLFGGSGSTLIACEILGRQARLLELDPRFVDVIVRRWQEFTGRTATLSGSDGRTFAEIESARAQERQDSAIGRAMFSEAQA